MVQIKWALPDPSFHQIKQVSSQMDAFRWDLHIRSPRSTVGAMVQKVKFGQLRSLFLIKLKSNLINLFLVLHWFSYLSSLIRMIWWCTTYDHVSKDLEEQFSDHKNFREQSPDLIVHISGIYEEEFKSSWNSW
jgi:hypothetical protein